ncbi:hypothetical protein EV421DRAFT_1690453, partial [Armillaria borealis]
MYHDKQFQCDATFSFVAFSHHQVKASTSGTFLLADKQKFNGIAHRLMNVNQSVLSDLATRLAKGETIVPSTVAEKYCYQIIKDLDHVAGRVHGTTTSKRYMNNEIWSLIADKGAPSWYVTISPIDNKHPLCLYFAGEDKEFTSIPILDYKEKQRLIVNNPAAAARFFNFLVEMFIKEILGCKPNKRSCGFYGDTSAYYGTVEQ